MDATDAQAVEVRFLGWTDEITDCDRCGKAGLKSTAAIEIEGEIAYYGCVCASRVLSGQHGVEINAAKVRREVEKAHADQVACAERFDRGFYEADRDAAVEALAKIDRALSWHIGIGFDGTFNASKRLGGHGNRFERIESKDLAAVAAWVESNNADGVAAYRARHN